MSGDMYVHGLSLPTRRLNSSRPDNGEAELATAAKFPTIHIGQPKPRGRVNLSSTFSNLFEKPENRRNGLSSDSRRSGDAADTEPLSQRAKNIEKIPYPKSSHFHELQETIPSATAGTLPRKVDLGSKAGIISKSLRLFPHQISGKHNRKALQRGELPKTRSFSLSCTDVPDDDQANTSSSVRSPLSTEPLQKVRSGSSSYPTEGIRSPASHTQSPEPIGDIRRSISEYCDMGNLLQTTWDLLDASTSMKPAQDLIPGPACNGQAMTAADNEKAGTDVGNRDSNPFSDEFTLDNSKRIPTDPSWQTILSDLTTERDLGSPSQLGSDSSNRAPSTVQNIGNNANTNGSIHADNTATNGPARTDTLRPTIGRHSIHLSFGSRLPTFNHEPASSSASTLECPAEKFKFRKWLKAVYSKTRSRFQFASRPRALRNLAKFRVKAVRPRPKKNKKAADKPKGQKPHQKFLSVSTKKHGKWGCRLLDTTKKKRSLQLMHFRRGSATDSPLRARSCPANIGCRVPE
ncbi:hypothetical protein F5Y16DRAFT_399267 [Xylariaceae sp. FL0255]|nr:hypothetical protein F5Y16DRAFT_399267 [Xylariaceae sp. FL0255]